MSTTLSPEVEGYIENLNKQLEAERTRRIGVETQLTNVSNYGTSGKEQNVIEIQLELDEFKDKIFHLLSGHEVKVNTETNQEYYAEPDDDRLKTFSPYGVKQIMNLLSMYININTLMGYYDEPTIKWKVRDFGIELSDLFLTRYEILLYYPTPEDLYEKYLPIFQKKDLPFTTEELYAKCVEWSEDELASREKLLPIICLGIVDMVHSSYTRAFQGKEKTSLGERGINIHQSNAGVPELMLPKKGGFFSGLKG